MKDNWILCTEQCAPLEEDVLLYLIDGDYRYRIGHLSRQTGRWMSQDYCFITDHVTHWQPLEAPKGV